MKLTRRGRLVRAVFIVVAIYSLIWLSCHVWYTPEGYCLGSFLECMP